MDDNTTPFQTFITLVSLDQQINTLNKEITVQEKQSDQLAQKRLQLDAELAQVKQRVQSMQKEVDAYELEMKDLDDRERKKKQTLDAISSHKEYLSIKTEIDALKKQQHTLEDTLIEVWNNLENAQKDYTQKYTAHEQKVASMAAEGAALQEKKQTLVTERDKKIEERLPVQSKVPEEWINKYTQMRAKVADPVVSVVDGACTACFYHMSEQDMIALSRRRLIQCKDCFRLLYLPAAHGTQPTPPTP